MDENKNKLFREKSIERISSPEKLDDYIKVANPGIWMLLASIIVLLLGFIVWAAVANIQTTIPCVVDCEKGICTCFLSEQYITNDQVKVGMKVECNGQEYTIDAIDGRALEATDVLTEYELHIGEFSDGEWIHAFSLDRLTDEGVYKASVIVEEISPISFILNNG